MEKSACEDFILYNIYTMSKPNHNYKQLFGFIVDPRNKDKSGSLVPPIVKDNYKGKDRVRFYVKSAKTLNDKSAPFFSVTLWEEAAKKHGEFIALGNPVFVEGPYNKKDGDDGRVFHNLSVTRAPGIFWTALSSADAGAASLAGLITSDSGKTSAKIDEDAETYDINDIL